MSDVMVTPVVTPIMTPPVRKLEIAMERVWRGCVTPGVSRSSSVVSPVCGSDGTWTPGYECEEEVMGEREINHGNLPSFLASAIAGVFEKFAAGSEGEEGVFTWDCAPMSLADYVQRIADYSCLSVAPYIVAVMFLDRLDARHPHIIGHRNIHKLFLTALCVAHKAIEEYQLLNSTFSVIGAVSLPTLRACEAQFVTLLDWDLGVNNEVFSNYMELVHAEAGIPVSCAGNIGFLGH
eukprot:TRINITY_DN14818_c0_g1_i1.p1 TRINITY_DN14818_c0_g1~~TRINITY_DN14818_c0_g1_i1.p1  ORF type:complete len:236 (+),score=50.28 TRINITY_DN14818_c0_g1_i1:236-943(+)